MIGESVFIVNIIYGIMTKDIDEIKRERIKELKQQQESGDGTDIEEQQKKAEEQKSALLKKLLTEDARRRLNTVKMAKPEIAEEAESQIIALAQSGRISDEVTEETMKRILQELTDQNSTDYDIKGMGS